ncbi:uncharacterized protein LOC8265172 [Ricinus communis]|uniref:Uncharacterized protein n=1 Tax=Ricinus communis TaxID=3988 RepID=B9RNJ5_RICCO|nr:uncharacterized protein LOC8265172 [Ricinus communis]EEF47050.1 conserved hypothetical protein [Ricinus communis]|eukprot:XP_002515066.1 uncharacterized protein LOC8265172 [Ricinus communis]
MGNCVFKGFGVMEVQEMVKVVTTNGGIMELFAPITAECITNEFPGHALYRSPDLFSPPLLHNEELHGGHLYYLLPLKTNKNSSTTTRNNNINSNDMIAVNSSSSSSTSKQVPYRMSFDNQRVVKRSAEAEVYPRYNSSGVWKVKLVISPEQLAGILAQEARTEELIENVRTVAKCGHGFSSSVANSDQWSVSSSWKGSAEPENNGVDI